MNLNNVIVITFCFSMGIVGIIEGYTSQNILSLLCSGLSGIYLIGVGVHLLIKICGNS